MGIDQGRRHIARMAGHVADAFDAFQLRDLLQQGLERQAGAMGIKPVPCIDILSQQRDLAHPAGRQFADFGQNGVERAREFGTARIGYHAEGAEFVAAFLHGYKGGDATVFDAGLTGIWQSREFVLDRKFGIDHGFELGGLQHFGQAVIALRADHQINRRFTPQNLGPFGLRHTARHHNLHRKPFGLAVALHAADASQFRIDLVGGFFADMAGVEHHQFGVFDGFGFDIAVWCQRIGHALGIIDIHLAAVGLDKNLLHETSLACSARCENSYCA